MKTRALLFAATALALACGDKEDGDSGGDSGASGGLSAADQAAAEDLWSEISGYETWNQHADWTGIQASEDGTHGSHVQIWFNGTAAGSFEGGGDEMAEGSILVKEGYSSADGATVNAVTVMKKDGGDWFWARYSASGDVTTAGADAAGSCGGCHAAGKDGIRFISW